MPFQGRKPNKLKENYAKFNDLKDDDYELCVICGKKTNVMRSEPVERRADYFPGSGQLCHECAIRNATEDAFAMRNGFTYGLPVYSKDKEAEKS